MKLSSVVSECGAHTQILAWQKSGPWMTISGEEKQNKDSSLQVSQSHIDKWISPIMMFLRRQLGQRLGFPCLQKKKKKPSRRYTISVLGFRKASQSCGLSPRGDQPVPESGHFINQELKVGPQWGSLILLVFIPFDHR